MRGDKGDTGLPGKPGAIGPAGDKGDKVSVYVFSGKKICTKFFDSVSS